MLTRVVFPIATGMEPGANNFVVPLQIGGEVGNETAVMLGRRLEDTVAMTGSSDKR